VDRYKIRLYRFIERYTNDAEDARDVTQDVFIKVYGALDSYDSKYKFSTWLFRIAGNAAIDQLRRRRVKTVPLEFPNDDDGSRTIDPRDLRPDPLAELGRARLRKALDEAIERRAPLRGDRRAEGAPPGDGQEQTFSSPTGFARSFAARHRIGETG
jgi:RNA polymerase sigma-70 factor (ECF subfamily)